MYLSNGRLWEVKNKRNFQSISSKSGRDRLQELGSKYSDFTWKRLVLRGEVVTTGGSTVVPILSTVMLSPRSCIVEYVIN